ncbi:hypothetical protein SEVIR_1G328866v4 [Setaria viridis]
MTFGKFSKSFIIYTDMANFHAMVQGIPAFPTGTPPSTLPATTASRHPLTSCPSTTTTTRTSTRATLLLPQRRRSRTSGSAGSGSTPAGHSAATTAAYWDGGVRRVAVGWRATGAGTGGCG